MSHYRADTPLSRLNREAARGPVAVDPELFDFIAECLRWSRESDGAFDVTVGPLMKAWGFFRDEGRLPDEAEIRAALAVVGYRHVGSTASATRSASTARASSSTSEASARATPSTASSRCCGAEASLRRSSTSAAAASTGLARLPARRLGSRHRGPDGSRPRGRVCRCATGR